MSSYLGILLVKHALWTALLYLVSFTAFALDSSPSVFYPLPTESQGRVFAAKQLSLASNGGLWIQDVKGKVLFFDGQAVAPKRGSALPYEPENLVIYQDQFWSYDKNTVYRSAANQPKTKVFELPPGSEINKMGISKGHIWFTDRTQFVTYRIVDGELNTYSMKELSHYNKKTSVVVNDALFVRTRWALATDVGVFLSEDKGFIQIPRSKDSPIDKLYFSDSRGEIVMSSPKGAIVYDIYVPTKPKYIMPTPNFTAFSETTQAYWIGTPQGLYVYSFITGKIEKFSGEQNLGFALSGRKINAIVHDNSSGVWIATNKNIHYFSLFGDKFERYSGRYIGTDSSHIKIDNFIAMENRSGYWMLKRAGLFKFHADKENRRELVYKGQVHNLVESKGLLWLATNKGLVVLNSDDVKPAKHVKIPPPLTHSRITHLAFDQKGLLWVANDDAVWCIDIVANEVKLIAEHWMLPQYGDAFLKSMTISSDNVVLLGTEHGVYLIKDRQLKFIANSDRYGAIHSMAEGREQQVWLASNYGLNVLDMNTELLFSLPMVDEHVSPHCLVRNRTGVWLTSSAGLTHYTIDGQLITHYGQPFGVIDNEFRNGFCLTDPNDDHSLLFGSWHSLVRLNSRDLMVSQIPEANVLFSQVKVNQQLVAFGSGGDTDVVAPFGETIAIQMGIIPNISGATLEYRLNRNDAWAPLDGFQIAMEGLMPGKHALDVRPVINGIERGGVKTLNFLIEKPWYLTSFAFLAYGLLLIAAPFGVFYWRSRIMSHTNRRLKAQVALKTNQLRHQSRILLSNNHQLRKQIQVRRFIFSQAIQSFRDRLKHSERSVESTRDFEQQDMIDRISSELELLLNVRESQGQAVPAYNLSLIINSILNGWLHDVNKSGINLDVDMSDNRELYAVLHYFNLDVMLNLVFYSMIKRCSRHQTVKIRLFDYQQRVFLEITDTGSAIDLDEEGSWTDIRKLLNNSGGELSLQNNLDSNQVKLSWPLSHVFDEKSVVELDELSLKPEQTDNTDPFLRRLEALVIKHYTDPEFSTSTAAKMLYVSERSLQRRIKASSQRTFSDYLSEVRLDQACRQLLAGGKVADVAHNCGFNEPSYFSQRFKHRFGVSPTQFVEQSDSHEDVY